MLVTRSFDVTLICAWINGWVNNREAGDFRRQHAHYDAIEMIKNLSRFIKIRQSWDPLSFIIGIPVQVRRHLYTETAATSYNKSREFSNPFDLELFGHSGIWHVFRLYRSWYSFWLSVSWYMFMTRCRHSGWPIRSRGISQYFEQVWKRMKRYLCMQSLLEYDSASNIIIQCFWQWRFHFSRQHYNLDADIEIWVQSITFNANILL